MTEETKEPEIDKVKVAKIMQRIIVAETKNLKTKEKMDSAMVKEIQKIIEEEVKCY